MRGIKLRAWDDVSKKMSYSSTEQFDDSLLFRFEHFETENPVYMQYTGITDKNGKDIYEWDIVEFSIFNGLSQIDGRAKVYFDKGCFRLNQFHPLEDYIDGQIFRVCGNIYENPELIEVS